MPGLELRSDVVELTASLMNISSESLDEKAIADEIESALREQAPHLELLRVHNSIIARTTLGRAQRVVIAGHIDTVPAADNFGARLIGDELWGLGSTDMKSGVAVALHLAATMTEPSRDVSFVLYEAEEIASIHNGLGKLVDSHPDWLRADFAILMEPTNGVIEAGCQGTMRFEVTARGVRAHSARAWVGQNAIHNLSPILERVKSFQARTPLIDGLEFHEGLNAVFVSGGVAGNVVPDQATVTINYRFAPDIDQATAEAQMRELFSGYELVITDSAPGALPGLSHVAVQDFIAAANTEVQPKFGWTDVARFSALGVPALNFGPGDPALAHHSDERVPVAQIQSVLETTRNWLQSEA